MNLTDRPHRRRAAAAAVGVALLALAGCGSDRTAGAQPDPRGGFESTAFGAAPVPGDADPTSGLVTEGGTQTQSFALAGTTPDAAIRAYQALATGDGWTTTDGPTATGATDWSITMGHDGDTLVATTSPSTDGDGAADTELTLEVTPG